jgi:hypothetical protein
MHHLQNMDCPFELREPMIYYFFKEREKEREREQQHFWVSTFYVLLTSQPVHEPHELPSFTGELLITVIPSLYHGQAQ